MLLCIRNSFCNFNKASVAPDATCRIAFDETPGWKFQTEPVRLVPGQISDLKATITAPAGAKVFFRLPVTAEYSGDGWMLKCRDNLTTLTENRICQWIVSGPFECETNAPFDSRKFVPENPVNLKVTYETLAGKKGWQLLTNANVHGAMNVGGIVGTNTKHSAVIALSVLRVTRPTTIRIAAHDAARLFIDGARLGSDMPRFAWGSVTLAPGLHILKAVTTAPEKSAAWELRIACEISRDCLPGDLTVVPAEEVLRMDSLQSAKNGNLQ